MTAIGPGGLLQQGREFEVLSSQQPAPRPRAFFRRRAPAARQWRLSGWPARILLACLLALTAGYVFFAARQYRAWAWAQSQRPSDLELAVRLRPASAEYHDKLGSLRFYVDGNPAQASKEFETAARLEPFAARHWLMLATSYFALGDVPRFRAALERVLQVDPTTPDISWEVANYWLSSGETDRALRAFRTVLLYDTSKVPRAVQVSWQATHDVNQVMEMALPPSPNVYAAFLQVLTREPDPGPAQRVWSALVGLGQPVPPESVFPYLEYLLRHGKSLEAQRAWSALLQLNSTSALISGENRLTDGGFEGESFNTGGFFWQMVARPGVQVSVDGETAHSGSRCLLLTLDNATGADLGVFQIVPVRSNARYLLSGFAKASELLTAHGPRLAVVDHFSGRLLASSDEVMGTTGWRELTATFTTGADTSAVEVRLARDGPGIIAGKLWLDDLSLVQP